MELGRKLLSHEEKLQYLTELMGEDIPFSEIADRFQIHAVTLGRFCETHLSIEYKEHRKRLSKKRVKS
jgi:predicted DNA-binding protein YlxM (UPF0122 family)